MKRKSKKYTKSPARRLFDKLLINDNDKFIGYEGFLSLSHGVMPPYNPLKYFAASHQAWDEAAMNMAELFRHCRTQQTLEQLPLLSAAEEDLENRYLSRAALILGCLAHAYYINDHLEDQTASKPLPPAIEEPWKKVCQRLGRPHTALTATDLFIYNYQLRDEKAPDLFEFENLDLLIDCYGIPSERIFYLTFIKIAADFTPAIELMVKAQEAVMACDDDALCEVLAALFPILHLLNQNFMKISLLPQNKNYVNPIVWSLITAVFGGSYREKDIGLKGSLSPVIPLLDVFFGRVKYDSFIGKQYATDFQWIPGLHQEFFHALTQYPVKKYVMLSNNKQLIYHFQQALGLYAGEEGFFSLHQRKIYVYMELGFRAGREATNAGFSSVGHLAPWEELDHHFTEAKTERLYGLKFVPYEYELAGVKKINAETSEVSIKANLTVPYYEVCDRFNFYPANRQGLIKRTLETLKAHNDAMIDITEAWGKSIGFRLNQSIPAQIPLALFLQHAKLRPVSNRVIKHLYLLVGQHKLLEILHSHRVDQYELPDIFQIISDHGYDVRRFWQVKSWHKENLSRYISPETYRTYSITSLCADSKKTRQLDFLVKQYTYEKPHNRENAYGVGSCFLTAQKYKQLFHGKVSFNYFFRIAVDSLDPLVMFVGGVGISAVRALYLYRAKSGKSKKDWLVCSVSHADDFFYKSEIEALAEKKLLNFLIIFSDEFEKALRYSHDPSYQNKIKKIEQNLKYIGDLEENNMVVDKLWHFILPKEKGGENASFYIAGSAPFANSALSFMKNVIQDQLSMTAHQPISYEKAQECFVNLAGEGRLFLDIYTSERSKATTLFTETDNYYPSAIAEYDMTTLQNYLVIDGMVYDMTEYKFMHPGGEQIINLYCGTDATRPFQNVQHHLNSTAEAQLDLSKIGLLRYPQLAQVSEPVVIDGKLKTTFLSDVYDLWINYLYDIVRHLNGIFINGNAFFSNNEEAKILHKSSVVLLLNIHQDFIQKAVPKLMKKDLDALWRYVICFFGKEQAYNTLPIKLKELLFSPFSSKAQVTLSTIKSLILESNDAEHAIRIDLIKRLRHIDQSFLLALKANFIEGAQVFEKNDNKDDSLEGASLVSLLNKIPTILKNYYQSLITLNEQLTDK